MAVEIRRLRPGDEEVVRRLSVEDAHFEQVGVEPRLRIPHTLESAREFLAVETNYQLVAFAEDEPVGQLIAYELIRRHGDGRMMLVYEVGVRRDSRRQGVGRGLFDVLRSLCRERGIARAFLITNESNLDAMAFYRSLGARRDHDDDVVLDFDWS
jgi:ribosomal protein S18 acetylase RimI-like enzyme